MEIAGIEKLQGKCNNCECASCAKGLFGSTKPGHRKCGIIPCGSCTKTEVHNCPDYMEINGADVHCAESTDPVGEIGQMTIIND